MDGDDGRTAVPGGYLYRRHTLAVRVAHAINLVALVLLFMSGLAIFNAHPALYWGKSSYTGAPPILAIGLAEGPNDTVRGVTTVGGASFDTTGVLGLSNDRRGRPSARAFPWWITVPDDQWLSMARSWHLFFAWVLLLNGLFYLVHGIASRHFARDVVPTGAEMRGIGGSILDHLRFRHARGEAARRYNVLQKLAYLAVVFVLLPLTILTGLGMSPWLNGLWPGWVDLLGGRQSARTIHFVCAWSIVLFALVHVFMLLVTGPWNHVRSMISGRYRIDTSHAESRHEAR
ncbi:MAG TPA: cytochrome b/b6 domain-containing protein [Casimicrobiaceae bacterium]|nr:cytochrome b/b6 domain-containing protein [Casimicrobiaceae bacterium]